jgi:hypothetical protein
VTSLESLLYSFSFVISSVLLIEVVLTAICVPGVLAVARTAAFDVAPIHCKKRLSGYISKLFPARESLGNDISGGQENR